MGVGELIMTMIWMGSGSNLSRYADFAYFKDSGIGQDDSSRYWFDQPGFTCPEGDSGGGSIEMESSGGKAR